MKYYKNTQNGCIYRTHNVLYNDGTRGVGLSRWSWDFGNWGGHIDNRIERHKQIAAGVEMIEMSQHEAKTYIERHMGETMGDYFWKDDNQKPI